MDPFIGEIRLCGFNFAPQGWAPCDGRLLTISQNTALFSLLGTTFGGNGTSNFGLPDLRLDVARVQFHEQLAFADAVAGLEIHQAHAAHHLAGDRARRSRADRAGGLVRGRPFGGRDLQDLYRSWSGR